MAEKDMADEITETEVSEQEELEEQESQAEEPEVEEPETETVEKPVKPKRVSRPKRQKVKQGHKLVWLTLIILMVPVLVIGYVLLTSAKESDQPVEGNRFGVNDLNPKIQQSQLDAIQADLMNIGGMETATIDLKSATLRVHLNMVDAADELTLEAAANQAYDIVNQYLPIETYFTNTPEGKNYDLEIDSYNYLVDDAHPVDGWRFLKISKSGAGNKVTDHITRPKNPELTAAVKAQNIQVPNEEAQDSEVPEETEDPGLYLGEDGVYDYTDPYQYYE